MKMTIEILEQQNACAPMREQFKALFGQEVEVTEALCVKHYHEFGLAWNWAADHFLQHEYQHAYYKALEPLQEKYRKQEIPLRWDEYELEKARCFGELYVLQGTRHERE